MKRALLFGGLPVIAGIALIGFWASTNAAASRESDRAQVLATIETASVQPGAVDLGYRYEFGGKEYRNPHGRLTVTSGANRYVAGRKVIAYVNPTTPSDSYLERSAAPSQQGLIAGVVLIVIGLPIGIYLLRDRSPRPKRARTAARPMSRLKPPPSIPRR